MKGPKGHYAWSVTVGTKGQIVIPSEARRIFGIKPGDTLLVLADEERGIAIPPKTAVDVIANGIFGNTDFVQGE